MIINDMYTKCKYKCTYRLAIRFFSGKYLYANIVNLLSYYIQDHFGHKAKLQYKLVCYWKIMSLVLIL